MNIAHIRILKDFSVVAHNHEERIVDNLIEAVELAETLGASHIDYGEGPVCITEQEQSRWDEEMLRC